MGGIRPASRPVGKCKKSGIGRSKIYQRSLSSIRRNSYALMRRGYVRNEKNDVCPQRIGISARRCGLFSSPQSDPKSAEALYYRAFARSNRWGRSKESLADLSQAILFESETLAGLLRSRLKSCTSNPVNSNRPISDISEAIRPPSVRSHLLSLSRFTQDFEWGRQPKALPRSD